MGHVTESAWLYLVVSSEKQAETLPDQRAWAQGVATEHGWRIAREFSGVSTGKHGARKLLESLLAELHKTAKRDRPARVLMIRLDRAGRGLGLEAVAALAEIHALGVMVHTREDGDVRIARVSDTIKPILRILTGALENEARSDKSRENHRKKRELGQHAGHAPYGIVLVEKRPVAFEPEAQIVRELFVRRALGWGVHRLARYAAQYAPPKQRRGGGTRAMRWDESTVTRMLACATYRGIIVDEELWQEVQGIRGTPFPREAKYPWPLRGALRCTCGRMLTTCYSGNPRHRTRYYVCRNVAVHRDRYPFHRADVLEAQFVEILHYLAQNPDLPATAGAPVDVDALLAQRREHAAQLERVEARRRKVWLLYESDEVERAEVRDRLADLAKERATLLRGIEDMDARIAEVARIERSRESVANTIARMAEIWAHADIEMQRETAKTIADLWPLVVAPPRTARESQLIIDR